MYVDTDMLQSLDTGHQLVEDHVNTVAHGFSSCGVFWLCVLQSIMHPAWEEMRVI